MEEQRPPYFSAGVVAVLAIIAIFWQQSMLRAEFGDTVEAFGYAGKDVFLAGLLWFMGVICIRVYDLLTRALRRKIALEIVATIIAALRLLIATRHAPKVASSDIAVFALLLALAFLGLPWLNYMAGNTAERTLPQSVRDLSLLPGGAGPVDTAFKLCIAYLICAYLVFTT